MKIGIMGGTFDPIHNAHLLIASFAYDEFHLDKVIFMTGGNTPHKDMTGADAADRYEMVRCAVEDDERFEADDFEIKKEGYSYTVETLEYLKEKYPGAELYFIVGSDSLDYMDKWHECRRLFSMCVILLFERSGFPNIKKKAEELEREYSCRIERIDAPIIEISSSMIRARVSLGRSIRYIVPDHVIEYIHERGLYNGI